MSKGYQCLVLHAHLPYIRHPEYESFLEENWLFEAITETYIPLLLVLERLKEDGFKACMTVSLSPTLLTMLLDPFLQARYLAHLDKLRQLAAKEVRRTRSDPVFSGLARLYQEKLEETAEVFEQRYQCNLVAVFAQLQQDGVLELITSSATHGFLSLLKTEPAAIRAQLLVGARTFQSMVGVSAKGVWLPECNYFPGLEGFVEEAGFSYFFVDSHGIMNAAPRPYYGLSAPLACPNGLVAFGRDPDSSRQVWSRDEGYPGDCYYRDFYRDIGFDLDFDYIKPYILDGHTRTLTAVSYTHLDVYKRQVYAYWYIHASDMTKCLSRLAGKGLNAKLVLRFSDVSPKQGMNGLHDQFDIEVTEGSDNWYVNLWRDGKHYLAEIGLRTDEGVFEALSTSNEVIMPRAYPLSLIHI